MTPIAKSPRRARATLVIIPVLSLRAGENLGSGRWWRRQRSRAQARLRLRNSIMSRTMPIFLSGPTYLKAFPSGICEKCIIIITYKLTREMNAAWLLSESAGYRKISSNSRAAKYSNNFTLVSFGVISDSCGCNWLLSVYRWPLKS